LTKIDQSQLILNQSMKLKPVSD